ncbi:MAG: hypothetical protein PHT02_00175 [Tissierellia bacterium]|nr:hypothetical protein [Tissierellia bacterium]
MGTYDLFRKIVQSNLTAKERSISQIQYDIISDFYDSPSYKSVTINNTLRDVQITDENAINKNPNKKRVLCKPEEDINIGDDILWNSEHWLCTNIDSDKEIYAKGIIERCNNTLTFYKNSISYTLPCIITAVGSSMGLSDNETKYTSDLNNEIIVRVSNNTISQLIQVNDIFKIGKRNYKIMTDSDIVESGLLIFKMQVVLEEQEQHVFTLSILNEDNLQIAISQSLTINVEVTDNGVSVSNPNVLYSSSDEDIATINSDGVVTLLSEGIIEFTATLTSDNTVSDNVTVEVVAEEQNNYTVNISGSTSIIKGYTEDYSCIFKNNGVAYSDNSTFYLKADDNVSETILASITTQNVTNNTCTIRGVGLGYVKLFVRNEDSSIVSDGYRIKVENLF